MGTSIYLKYPPQFNFGGIRVLNLGCGFAQYRHPNVVNVDAYDNCSPDLTWDLNKTPYPFDDGSFDLILANHIFEHLPNWWDAFSECARILRENGHMEVWLPGNGSDSILGFRDHCNVINHCSFYGTHGTYRGAGNAWAEDALYSHANWLKLVHNYYRPEKKWWITYAPAKLRWWMCNHLRNILIEQGYTFRKITTEEYDAEIKRHKREYSKAVSVLSLPKTRVS